MSWRTRNQARSTSAGPIGAISKSSTARQLHVLVDEHVAELDVTPQQRGRWLGAREMGAAPRHAAANTAGATPSPAQSRYRAQCSSSRCQPPLVVPVRALGQDRPPQPGRRPSRGGGWPPGRRRTGRAAWPAPRRRPRPATPCAGRACSACTTRPATRGMTRKGAPTQVSSSSTARGTTARTPAAGQHLLQPALHGEVVGGEQAVAVGRQAHDPETARATFPGPSPHSHLGEDRLARQAGRGLDQRGEVRRRRRRVATLAPTGSARARRASRSRGSEIPMRSLKLSSWPMTTRGRAVPGPRR